MSSRRFPKLLVMLTSSITDTSGMMPVEELDYSSICDDDLVPGTNASGLLKEAVGDFRREAMAIARTALDFNDTIRSGPYLTVLPRFNEADFSLVLAWRGNGNTSYIAMTEQLPHLGQIGAEYAGYDPHGRITYFESQSPNLPI